MLRFEEESARRVLHSRMFKFRGSADLILDAAEGFDEKTKNEDEPRSHLETGYNFKSVSLPVFGIRSWSVLKSSSVP